MGMCVQMTGQDLQGNCSHPRDWLENKVGSRSEQGVVGTTQLKTDQAWP